MNATRSKPKSLIKPRHAMARGRDIRFIMINETFIFPLKLKYKAQNEMMNCILKKNKITKCD